MDFSAAMARGFALALATCTGAQALAQGAATGLPPELTFVRSQASALSRVSSIAARPGVRGMGVATFTYVLGLRRVVRKRDFRR